MSLSDIISKGLAALSQNPKATVFAEVADSYRKMGEYDKAIELAQKGVGFNPNYFPGKLVLARSLFERGDLEDSEKLLKDIYRFSPENIHILRILSQLYYSRNDVDLAKPVLEKLLELDPADSVAKEQWLSLTQPQQLASSQTSTPVVEVPPATLTLAKMYFNQGLYQDTKAALFEILSVNPDHTEAKDLLVQTENIVMSQKQRSESPKQKVFNILLMRIAARRRAA